MTNSLPRYELEALELTSETHYGIIDLWNDRQHEKLDSYIGECGTTQYRYFLPGRKVVQAICDDLNAIAARPSPVSITHAKLLVAKWVRSGDNEGEHDALRSMDYLEEHLGEAAAHKFVRSISPIPPMTQRRREHGSHE